MDNSIIDLFEKYIGERCNREEFEKVFTLLKSGEYQEEWQQVIDTEADRLLSAGLQSELTDDQIDSIYMGIAAHLPSAQPRTYRLWPRIAAAASIIIAIGLGALFYVNEHAKHDAAQTLVKNDVAPGKLSATLTLANGQKIRLTQAANGKLAQQAGVQITKTQSGQLIYEIKQQKNSPDQINTLSTGNGETYQVKLPDGTQVWLNAASSLTYAVSLNENGKRKVKLTGEGYFEVAKDKAHPFIVQTASQYVEVLGTHFNINSYNDEPAVATTLLEGSVKITSGDKQQLIKPGEQALNSKGALAVTKVNTDNFVDWKDGDFNLDRIDFRVAMRKIARWYNVEVVYDASVPQNIRSGGWIPRNNSLSAVLRSIEKSGLVHFRIDNQKIYVSK